MQRGIVFVLSCLMFCYLVLQILSHIWYLSVGQADFFDFWSCLHIWLYLSLRLINVFFKNSLCQVFDLCDHDAGANGNQENGLRICRRLDKEDSSLLVYFLNFIRKRGFHQPILELAQGSLEGYRWSVSLSLLGCFWTQRDRTPLRVFVSFSNVRLLRAFYEGRCDFSS